MPEDVSDKEVDPDWIARFFEAAQDISSEQMQALWGRVLAGEVSRPGSYSLRTIETLKNLTQSEAHIVEKVLAYSFDGFILKLSDEFWRGREIHFSSFLLLQELQILEIGGIGLVYNKPSRERDTYLSYSTVADTLFRFSHEDPNRTFSIECYKLTKVGNDLARLVIRRDDPDYCQQIAELAIRSGLKVSRARVLERSDDGVRHTPFEDVVAEPKP
jgi:hypothetical protein